MVSWSHAQERYSRWQDPSLVLPPTVRDWVALVARESNGLVVVVVVVERLAPAGNVSLRIAKTA